MSFLSDNAQAEFSRSGGMYGPVLAAMRAKGQIPVDHVSREYPKVIRLSKGVATRKLSVTDGTRERHEWTESKEVFEDILVQSEDEEERVLAGGRTSVQIEDERLHLLTRAKSMGVLADPSWSTVRLKRELGEKLDEPAPAKDSLAALQARLAELEQVEAMKAKIAMLEAKLAGKTETPPVAMAPISFIAQAENPLLVPDSVSSAETDERDNIRRQLHTGGVEVDLRWGMATLRQKLADMKPARAA